jgi:hypothetical protein
MPEDTRDNKHRQNDYPIERVREQPRVYDCHATSRRERLHTVGCGVDRRHLGFRLLPLERQSDQEKTYRSHQDHGDPIGYVPRYDVFIHTVVSG